MAARVSTIGGEACEHTAGERQAARCCTRVQDSIHKLRPALKTTTRSMHVSCRLLSDSQDSESIFSHLRRRGSSGPVNAGCMLLGTTSWICLHVRVGSLVETCAVVVLAGWPG
jgi:hypothetical protein